MAPDSPRKPMLQVGLTGGLASGKTFVSAALASMGCQVIHADALGHQVLAPGGAAYAGVLAAFGTVDRKKLAAEVFHDAKRLELLNGLIHPHVWDLEEKLSAACPPDSIVVTEAAILIETGSYRRFEKLIVTWCTREQQIERAIERDGISRDEVLVRLDRQLPLDEKRKFADYVIDTSDGKDETLRQTRDVYNSLLRVQKER